MKKKNTINAERIRRRRRRTLLAIVVLLLTLALLVGIVYAVFKAVESIGGGGTVSSAVESTTISTTAAQELLKLDDTAFTARNVMLYRVNDDRILYEKGSHKRCYPASLTKLVTALTALAYSSPTDTITIGSEQALKPWDASTAGLSKGSTLPLSEALKALLLPSGADAAYAIAADVGRKQGGRMTDRQAVDKFCELMNQTAQSLGTEDCHFTNPDGYTDPAQYVTAADMLIISKSALANETIAAIVKQPSARITSSKGEFTVSNSNKLLQAGNPYYYEGTIGLKTGTTAEAGRCLIAAAEQNGQTLICVLLDAATENDRFTETIALLDAGFEKK